MAATSVHSRHLVLSGTKYPRPQLVAATLLAVLSPVLLALDTPSSHIVERNGLRSTTQIADISQGSADFVIGDLPLARIAAFGALAGSSAQMLSLPTAATATVPSYNIPGFKGVLNFSPASLSGIWLGQITKWNDVAIGKDNPGTQLPAERIVLVDQVNENGGTDAWTTYLTEFSPKWKSAIGRTSSLILPIELKTSDTTETARLIAQTVYSFSFVELWACKKFGLRLGRVKNRADHFVEASAQTIGAAVQTVTTLEDPQPFLASAKTTQAYPISNFTWITIPVSMTDPLKRERVIAMVRWMLTDGQRSTAELFYAPLPLKLVTLDLRFLSEIH